MQMVQKILKILVYVIIFGVFLVFAMANDDSVQVNFKFARTLPMPVWALIFISMAIGLIVGLLLTVGSVIAANAEKKRLRKEIRSTKNELNRMRNVSIEEDFDEEKLPAKTESSDETKTNEAT